MSRGRSGFRLLSAADINSLLSVELALEAMRRCFTMEGAGEAGEYRRVDVVHPRGWMRVLPAVMAGMGVFGHKAITLTHGLGVRYAVTVFDLETGALAALLDGDAVTGARTGATAALATELLAPPVVETAAIIGTGSVARTQLPALQEVRPARQIRVFSRRPENRAAFIEELREVVDADLMACATLEEAIEGASLVTLATKSPTPVLPLEAVAPGVHVNSVGSARPDLFELDPRSFSRFDLVVCDSVGLVFSESGDAVVAAAQGFRVAAAHELADLVSGRAGGRSEATQATLFKSTGTGVQDLALAATLLGLAEERGVGRWIDDPLSLKQFGPTGRT